MSASVRTRPFPLLGPAGYRTMPWKNGGGRTTEIAVHPQGAGLADFAWRISLADVAADGPFSAFPGVDRTLVLLAGRGMRLTGGGMDHDLRAAMDAVTFPGEAEPDCTLLDGPTRDFNLMVRRGAFGGALEVVRAAARRFDAAGKFVCYAAAGACECSFAGAPLLRVPQDHTLLIENADAGDTLTVRALDGGGAALVCTLVPVGGGAR